MKRKMKILILAVLAILLLSVFISSASALRNSHRKIIEVAFMNGYITALKLDIENINQLKEDKSLLKKRVQEETKKYLGMVQSLNRENE